MVSISGVGSPAVSLIFILVKRQQVLGLADVAEPVLSELFNSHSLSRKGQAAFTHTAVCGRAAYLEPSLCNVPKEERGQHGSPAQECTATGHRNTKYAWRRDTKLSDLELKCIIIWAYAAAQIKHSSLARDKFKLQEQAAQLWLVL